MKKWWNNFKQDLLFNIAMSLLSILMYVFVILLMIFAFKELITQIF